MICLRRLLFVLIVCSTLAWVDGMKAAETAANVAASFRFWDNLGPDVASQGNRSLRIPKTHPYLALTPTDIERARSGSTLGLGRTNDHEMPLGGRCPSQ